MDRVTVLTPALQVIFSAQSTAMKTHHRNLCDVEICSQSDWRQSGNLSTTATSVDSVSVPELMEKSKHKILKLIEQTECTQRETTCPEPFPPKHTNDPLVDTKHECSYPRPIISGTKSVPKSKAGRLSPN